MAGIPAFDRARIIETLDRHGVEYMVVGGIGAQLHGATGRRRTSTPYRRPPRRTSADLRLRSES